MTKAKEVLDFLNSIEGAGYGGLASFEIARAHVKDMIAQPQTPQVPWKGDLSVDLRKGSLSVNADGVTLIDEVGVCWALVFPDKNGLYDHATIIAGALAHSRPVGNSK